MVSPERVARWLAVASLQTAPQRACFQTGTETGFRYIPVPEQFKRYVVRMEYRNEKHEPEIVARTGLVVLSRYHRLPTGRCGDVQEQPPAIKEESHSSGGWLFSGLRAWSRGHVPGRNARSVPQR
jgi:hypothetical protein